MEAFTYKGISDGKYVDGEIEALNLDEASHKLKEQKVIITNIVRSSSKKKTDKKDKKKSKGSSLFGKKKAKVEDVLMFSKQFATMVKAGVPILQVNPDFHVDPVYGLFLLETQPVIKIEMIENIRNFFI